MLTSQRTNDNGTVHRAGALATAVLAACALLAPVAVAAGPPSVSTTTDATGVTQTAATIHGTVNPNGSEVSDCHVDYGTTTGYGQRAACDVAPGSGTAEVAVAATITNLTPSTRYHFRVVAGNGAGAGEGSDSFLDTQDPPAPTATTTAPSALGGGHATASGTVNPNGLDTSCSFDYGTSASYGYSAPCDEVVGAGTSPVQVHATLNGLTPGLQVHYRLVAYNKTGTTNGADQTFTMPLESGGPGTTDDGDTAARGSVSLPSRIRVRSGRATTRVTCRGAGACHGTLTLTARGRGGHARSVKVAGIRVDLAPGQSRAVTIRLSTAGRAALRRSRALRVTARGVGADAQLTLTARG